MRTEGVIKKSRARVFGDFRPEAVNLFSMEMGIYLAPFHSSFSGYGKSACGKPWGPLSDAVERGEGPYDIPGDDPSLFSRRHHGGNLTWGVCRQQVRNRLRTGDVVVFSSFRNALDVRKVEYRLCAVTTVERKIRQTDIWCAPELRVYRKYLNLLIRPNRSSDGWEHHEPGAKDAGHMWANNQITSPSS